MAETGEHLLRLQPLGGGLLVDRLPHLGQWTVFVVGHLFKAGSIPS